MKSKELEKAEKKLGKWKNAFPGQKANEVKKELEELRRNTSQASSSTGINTQMFEFHQEKIKELEKKIGDLELEEGDKEKELEETKKWLEGLKNAKPETLAEAAERVKSEWIEATKVGVEQGNKAIPLAGGVVGGLLGWGSGAAGFAVETGLYTLNKVFKGASEDSIKELARKFEEFQTEKKELEEKIKKLEEEKGELEKEKSKSEGDHVADKKKLEEDNKELEKKLKKNKEKKKEFKKKIEKLERELERVQQSQNSNLQAQVLQGGKQ